MSTSLTHVLRDVIKKAAAAPATTGTNEELAKLRKRFDNCSDVVVVLADCSGSMSDVIGSSDLHKIDHLRIAITDLMKAHPKIVLIAFGSYAKILRGPEELPDWFHLMGSTALTEAIEMAVPMRPRRTVIISDGCPNNQDSSAAAIEELTGRVDTVYCGPDGHPAITFLQSLARKGAGQHMTFDGCRELSPMIRGLLA